MGFHFFKWIKHQAHKVSHKIKKTFHKVTHWVKKKSKKVYDKVKEVAHKAYTKVIKPVGEHIIEDIKILEDLGRKTAKATGDVIEGLGEGAKGLGKMLPVIVVGGLVVAGAVLLK